MTDLLWIAHLRTDHKLPNPEIHRWYKMTSYASLLAPQKHYKLNSQ